MRWTQEKNIALAPTQDYRTDDENFIFHVKRVGLLYTQRFWRDDLDRAPQVYDPESAYNLLLSPANCLSRWGFFLNIGLQKYRNGKITFTSSKGYDKMVTTLPGQDPIIENQDFLIRDLEKPQFKAEFIQTETVLDWESEEQMRDSDFIKKKVQLFDTGEEGFIIDSSVKGKVATLTLLKI